MKRLIPVLAVLLILLLVPSGDLVSRDKSYFAGPGDEVYDGDPGGDDHPWGEQQGFGSSGLEPMRVTPRVATGVPSLDMVFNFPVLGSYLASGFYQFCGSHLKPVSSTSSCLQEDINTNSSSSAGSGRADK